MRCQWAQLSPWPNCQSLANATLGYARHSRLRSRVIAINTSPLMVEKLALPGPAGSLEALLETPARGSNPGIAVVCHPHPLYGGNMSNKVVHTLARGCNELGMGALRFNYRGVGGSAGAYDQGAGETDDALAVLDWVSVRWSGVPLFLAGFSFGGAVAIRAAARREVQRLVSVAPAIERITVSDPLPRCPWLLIQGTEDEVIDAAATQRWVTALPHPPQLVMLEGVSHFFHGHLTRLKDVVVRWLQE